MRERKLNIALERAKSPESEGVNSQVILDFLNECDKEKLRLHNFMILRHGKVVSEGSWSPYSAEYAHNAFSFSKAVSATAVLFMLEEGYCTLNTGVYSIFPEKRPEVLTDNMKELNVRHVLTMTSGKDIGNFEKLDEIEDWVKFYLDAPFTSVPGKKFAYSNLNSYMLCAIVKRLTGMSVTEYLTPRFYEPLGIEPCYWQSDKNGIEGGGWGIHMKIEDQAKFIQFYLQEGMWNDKQLLPKKLIKEATTQKVKTYNAFGMKDTAKGYGYQFWMNTCEGTYRAEGMFSQCAMAFPEQDACLVIQGGESDFEHVLNIIWKYFPKAFCDLRLVENFEVFEKLSKKISLLKVPDSLPETERNREIEELVDGRKIKSNTKATLIGPFETVLSAEKFESFNDISLSFYANEVDFSWINDGKENSIEAGMDGEYRYSKICSNGQELTTASKASWDKNGRLDIWIYILEKAQMRKMKFKFSEKSVSVRNVSVPSAIEGAAYFSTFTGLRVNKKLVKGADSLVGGAISRIVDPQIKGKFSDPVSYNLYTALTEYWDVPLVEKAGAE